MGSAALKYALSLPLVNSWSGGEVAKLLATIQGDEWEEKPRVFGSIEKASKPGLGGNGKGREGRESFLEVVKSRLRPEDERSWPARRWRKGPSR